MPRIVDDGVFARLMEELNAYRASGLTPQQVMALAHPDPAPLPLDLWGEDLHLGAGLLEDEGIDIALQSQELHDAGRWDK